MQEALLAHAQRRARSVGKGSILARAHVGAPLWHEVACRLDVRRLSLEPEACARQIASAATLQRVVLLARLPAPGTWDRLVAAELASLAAPPLALFVTDEADAATDLKGERFFVAPVLHGEARRSWASAVSP